MRAHQQRRILWMLNAAVGVGVVLLGIWIVVDVRPAAADVKVPAWLHVDPWDSPERHAASHALRPPVSREEVEEIDRSEFRGPGGHRFHWLYSGPMPPSAPVPRAGEERTADPVDELGVLGRVVLLIYIPPQGKTDVAEETVLVWEFVAGGDRIAFLPGDFIRRPGSEGTGGIRLVDVRPLDRYARRYVLHYTVHATDDAPSQKTGTYLYDGEIELDAALKKVLLGGLPRPPTPAAEPPAPSRAAETLPDVKDLAPHVVYETPGRVRVEFDRATYDYFRLADPDVIAKTVKTQVAHDGQGRVIGMRITGISAGSPAERFDLKPGDIVVSIDDHAVTSRSEALSFVQGLGADVSLVKVVINRRGRLITFHVDPRDPKTRRTARTLR